MNPTEGQLRRAIVTGGCSGLGAACVTRLRTDRIEVLTLDVSPEADIRVDITDTVAVQQAVSAAGPIDILVNSAGIVGPNKPLWEVDVDDWKRTFDVNVVGLFAVTKAVIPGMIERGGVASSAWRAWQARTATPTCRPTPRARPP